MGYAIGILLIAERSPRMGMIMRGDPGWRLIKPTAWVYNVRAWNGIAVLE
jgi:hypothetical protein